MSITGSPIKPGLFIIYSTSSTGDGSVCFLCRVKISWGIGLKLWYNAEKPMKTESYSFAVAKSCRISKSACASKEIRFPELHLPTKTER